MAVPKRRISRHRRGNRRSQQALKAVQLVECTNCSTMIRPHHVCPTCGFYRGKQMIVGRTS